MKRSRITVDRSRMHGKGREGYRWACRVLWDGEPVAEVNDDGDGGMLRWRMIGDCSPMPWRSKVYADMEEYAKGLPPVEPDLPANLDLLICVLADEAASPKVLVVPSVQR